MLKYFDLSKDSLYNHFFLNVFDDKLFINLIKILFKSKHNV